MPTGFEVYFQETPGGGRYWGFRRNANGDYYMTSRGYVNPLSALRQFLTQKGNKAYAGRRQHVNSWLNQHGMVNSKVNANTLKALVRTNDPNMYKRMLAASIITSFNKR